MNSADRPIQEPPVPAGDSTAGEPVRRERPGATSTPASDPRIPRVDGPTPDGGQERGAAAPSVSP
jgi:hypothetical protein